MLLADRGYDADWIRALAGRKGRAGQYSALDQINEQLPLFSLHQSDFAVGSQLVTTSSQPTIFVFDHA
jgi:hypothetical protein